MDNKNQNGAGDWKEWSRHVLLELGRLNDVQKATAEELKDMNLNLHRNTVSLDKHMSQTEAVKELAQEAHRKNDLFQISLDNYKTEVEKEFKPLKEHVTLVNTIFKWLLPSGVFLALPAAIYYTLKLFGKI